MLKRNWPILVLGCAIVASTLLLLYLGREQTPLVDQWGYFYAYRGWGLSTLLTPHNGHLLAFPLIVEKVIAAVFGLESQLPFQLLNLTLSAMVAVLLFTLIRDSIGDLLALAAATLMLFYGAGADVLIPTFQIGNLIGLASGLAMILALRRQTGAGDLAACALLTLSLASFSIGIAFAAAATAALALRPAGRRLRRCWIVLLPVLLYAGWDVWALKFDQQNLYVHNLKTIGSSLADQASAALSALTGLFTTPNGPRPTENLIPIRTTWGPVLVGGLAVLVYWRLRRVPRPSHDAIVAIVALLVYFLLVGIALNQFRNTFDTRLVYLGSVLMLLAVAQFLAPYRPSGGALAAIGVVFVFSMCANIAELGDVAQNFRAQSSAIRAKLAAVDLAGPAADDSVVVEDPPGAMNFSVEQFHELDADFGLPAYSGEELEASAPGARQVADEELVRVMDIAPEPGSSIVPPPGTPPLSVTVKASDPPPRRRGSCVSLLPRNGAKMAVLIDFKSGGIAYRSAAPVEVSIGRFADQPAVSLPARTGASRLMVPAGASRAPWAVGMWITGPTLVCPAVA